MPNWTPTDDNIDRLQQTVNHLTNRRATLMEANYPLTKDQVFAITAPPRMQEFVALGYDSIRKTGYICYELGPEQGLGRRSITQVLLPVPIHYAFQRSLNSHYQENRPAYFNREGISDACMKKLKQWTEKAIYERRLAMLTSTTVLEFFRHMPRGRLTMYHIMARWPGLKVMFSAAGEHYWHRRGSMWERYANEVPRNLQRWTWPQFGPEAEWREKYWRRMELTEETLLSCVSLSEPEQDNIVRLTARLVDWEKLGEMPF